MSGPLARLWNRVRGRGPAEDVEPDPNVANSRDTGGTSSEAGDAGTTTGTGATGEYVGQVAGGDDEGIDEESGAEARSEPDRGGQHRRDDG